MDQSLDKDAVFLEHLLNSITVAVYGVVVVIFSIVLLLISQARSRFHPLFCLLFFLLIFGYIISDALLVTSTLLSMLNYQDYQLDVIIDTLYQATYIYLTCVVAFCVLERLSATVFSKTYEFRKNWFVLVLGQVLSGLIVYVHIHVKRLGGRVSDIVQLALSCVILVSVSILLAINWHLHASARGERPLSFRYQISENVRVLRLITPVVLLDTGVTTTDVMGDMFFQINPKFEGDKYKSNHGYLQAYIALRAVAVILEYCIPIVIVTNKALRKDVYRILSKAVGVSSNARNGPSTPTTSEDFPTETWFTVRAQRGRRYTIEDYEVPEMVVKSGIAYSQLVPLGSYSPVNRFEEIMLQLQAGATKVQDTWIAQEDPQQIYLNYLRNQWAKRI